MSFSWAGKRSSKVKRNISDKEEALNVKRIVSEIGRWHHKLGLGQSNAVRKASNTKIKISKARRVFDNII